MIGLAERQRKSGRRLFTSSPDGGWYGFEDWSCEVDDAATAVSAVPTDRNLLLSGVSCRGRGRRHKNGWDRSGWKKNVVIGCGRSIGNGYRTRLPILEGWFPGTDILWETLKMLEYADPIGSPLTRESVGKRAGAHPGSHRAVHLSLHPEMHDRLIQSLEEFIIIRVFPFFRFQSAHLY